MHRSRSTHVYAAGWSVASTIAVVSMLIATRRYVLAAAIVAWMLGVVAVASALGNRRTRGEADSLPSGSTRP